MSIGHGGDVVERVPTDVDRSEFLLKEFSKRVEKLGFLPEPAGTVAPSFIADHLELRPIPLILTGHSVRIPGLRTSFPSDPFGILEQKGKEPFSVVAFIDVFEGILFVGDRSVRMGIEEGADQGVPTSGITDEKTIGPDPFEEFRLFFQKSLGPFPIPKGPIIPLKSFEGVHEGYGMGFRSLLPFSGLQR